MKITNLFTLLLLFPFAVFAQINQSFYEHYTGLISDELKITADLVKMEDSFSGFYYYEFKEEGIWISSKPIALDGHVDESGQFVLNEFGEGHSFFQGTLEASKLITGEWINDMLKDPVKFTFKATYSQNSIPLKAVEFYGQEYFDNDETKPNAKYHIAVLFPTSTLDQAVYHQLLSRIYHLIGFRGELTNQTNILSSLQKKYFSQFQNSLQNIQLDSFPSSFNWQKSIRFDVINNEGGVICLQVETYAKTGSNDGSKVRKYLVFNIAKNKLVKLDDLVNEENKQTLSILLQEKLRSHYHIKPETSLIDAGFFQDDINPSNNFYIHPGGIGFYYNVYEIAPFSNGPTDLFIPWEDLKGITNSIL